MTVMDYGDDETGNFRPAEPPTESIICVDCGGTAHLLTHSPHEGLWLAGDIVAYRCSDCLDRWDLVLVPLGE